MLLVGTGPERVGEETTHRDQRKEEDSPPKGKASKKARVSKAKSKGNADAKARGRGSARKAKNRRDNSPGQHNGEVEVGDKTVRRSAKELGITWPSAECSSSPSSAHYFIARGDAINGGVIFRCEYCGEIKWLPTIWADSERLGYMMRYNGVEEGYLRMLNRRPTAKVMVAKLQTLHRLKGKIPHDEYLVVVVAVMNDKHFGGVAGGKQ